MTLMVRETSETPRNDRMTYIQRFENARAELRQMVQQAQDNPLIYEPWRMKEVLDHITGWDDAVIAAIRAMCEDTIPATPAMRGPDAYNRETVTSREALPYAVSQKEWEASRVELLDLLCSLSDEQIHRQITLPWGGQASLEDLIDVFSEHEETHAGEIRAILQARTAGPA